MKERLWVIRMSYFFWTCTTWWTIWIEVVHLVGAVARRFVGELMLLVVLLGAEAAPPPPPPPPPPFILHHLAHHLKGGSDGHHGSSPSVVYAQPAAAVYAQPAAAVYAQPAAAVYAQPAAPVYAQSSYYPSRVPERLVIQVEPVHHRNLPAALSQTREVHVENQGHGELRRPVRVQTQTVKGSALPPHQTFVQVKVADPSRSPGNALAASAPASAGAGAAAAPAASAAAASANAASVNAFQHFGGVNFPPLRSTHVLGASGEEWLSELPAPDLHSISPHMSGVLKGPTDVPSHL